MDRCGTWKFGNYSRKYGDRNIHSTHPSSTKLAWVLQSVGGGRIDSRQNVTEAVFQVRSRSLTTMLPKLFCFVLVFHSVVLFPDRPLHHAAAAGAKPQRSEG